MGNFEVYIVRCGDEVLYIGEGKSGRHAHAISGVSHAYHLNRLHFEGFSLDIELIPVETKVEGLALEVELIKTLRPKYNTFGMQLKQSLSGLKHCKTHLNNPSNKLKSFIKHLSLNYKGGRVLHLDTRCKTQRDLYQTISRTTRHEDYSNTRFQFHDIIEGFSRVSPRVYEVRLKAEFIDNPVDFIKGFNMGVRYD